MLTFECDYTTGAVPEIIDRLVKTNLEPNPGYGGDQYTASAKEKIREACQCPNAGVYFTVGGTQTNQLVISCLLKSYEGVVAAETGHVNVHEAGAIEHSGHKVLAIPSHQGKMDAAELKTFMKGFYDDGNHEHMVFPGMVYISQPTELGSLYSKKELTDISDICREYAIPLFIDGARLGYGLMSDDSDLTLPEVAELCDVFYIGGTKVGALCGEAIVFTKNNMPAHFDAIAKQSGALLAKGKLLGMQFDTLFTDGLYLKVARQAIERKNRMVSILKKAGFTFYYESPTNQQFVIVEDSYYAALMEKVRVSFWEKVDDTHTAIRFCTSWSTTDEDLNQLAAILGVTE